MNHKGPWWWYTAALLAVAVGLTVYFTAYVWRRVDKPQTGEAGVAVMNKGDFSYFYAAGKAMREGEDIYAVVPPGRDRAGYIYPPLIAFLYQPLTLLQINPAARVSLLINVAAMAGATAIMARALLERLGKRHDWQAVLAVAVFAAVLSTDKIRGELQMLQTNALVALALAIGLWQLDKKRWGFVWAGAALGFAINVKYQALALVFYLLFRRRWKALGATAGWTAFWGFLPAISIGFARDAAYLAQGFAGVLRLVGLGSSTNAANIEPISAGLSISITSAIARFVEKHSLPVSPMVLGAAVGVAWLAILFVLYRASRTRAIAWPRDHEQSAGPWPALVGMEWIVVIATVLAFSPQTNTRHLVLTAMVMELGLILFIEARGMARIVAGGAMVVLWMGLNLPPGHRDVTPGESSVAAWHTIGGPSWALLAATGMLVWVGLRLCVTAGAPAAMGEPTLALTGPAAG